MDRQSHLSTKQRLFIVSSGIVGTIMLSVSMSVLSSGAGGRPAQQQRDSLPLVKSHAESLQFISTERTDFELITRIRNTSAKSITAYTVSLCGVPLFAADYTIGDNSIAPGNVLEIKMPIQAVSDKCGNATQPIITILAVVFDDRSSEGEFRWVKGILDNRRGEKIQLRRINRILTKAANWADGDKPAGIDRLKSEIAALPLDEGEPPAVRGGLASARDRILYIIAELEQWHSRGPGIQSASNRQTTLRAELAGIRSLREGFTKLVSLNEKWISKY
jgi:hypothetical protein